jgi:cytidine deaminase
VDKNLTITWKELAVKDLGTGDQRLVTQARAALAGAYAPYSGFKVGAALQLTNELVVIGNNQENASFPNGLCAERTAMFAAAAGHPDVAFKTLAIVTEASSPVSPCGICRQTMFEYRERFGQAFRLILVDGHDHAILFDDAVDLLPLGFSSRHLRLK